MAATFRLGLATADRRDCGIILTSVSSVLNLERSSNLAVPVGWVLPAQNARAFPQDSAGRTQLTRESRPKVNKPWTAHRILHESSEAGGVVINLFNRLVAVVVWILLLASFVYVAVAPIRLFTAAVARIGAFAAPLTT